MKITIGANPNTEFKIEDAEGNDITQALQVKGLSLDINGKMGHTTVTMECYVDCIEILEANAQVTIIERESDR